MSINLSPLQRLPGLTYPALLPAQRGDVGPRPPEPEEADALHYLQLMWKRKWILAGSLLAGGGLALLISASQDRMYRTAISLEVQSFNADFPGVRSAGPTSTVVSDAAMESYIQTQAELLQDEHLIGEVVDKIGFDAFVLQPGWAEQLGFKAAEAESVRTRAVRNALRNLTVRPSAQTRLIKAAWDHRDPNVAATFLNALAERFIEDNLEARKKSTRNTRDWLAGQVDSHRGQLERAEDRMQTFAQQSGLLFTGEKDSVAEQKLRRIQDALADAQAERIKKQSFFEAALLSSPESLPGAEDSGPLREFHVKLTDLRRELAEVSTLFAPAHYKARQLQAQIAELEAAMAGEVRGRRDRIEGEYTAAKKRETLLAEQYQQQKGLIERQSGHVARYNALKREVETQRTFHDSMTKELQESSIAVGFGASNLRVVSPASAPARPFRPNFALNAVMGGFLGLLFGMGFAVLREKGDRSLKAPGELSMHLSLPELGAIPSAALDSMVRPRAFLRSGAEPSDLALASSEQESSMIADSFRAALASLFLNDIAETQSKVIVVTSTNPGEGKTTVLCNLGIMAAQCNRRVLLVDADFRRPRLHQIFGLSNDRGFCSDLESPEGLPQEALLDIASPTLIKGLWVMTSGTTTTTPNLLRSSWLPRAIKLLRQQFDLVLIDCPPAVSLADARILGRLSDGVILVVRSGKTTRDAAQAVVRRFITERIPVMGTILNDWNPKETGYYSYHAYEPYQSDARFQRS